MNMQQITDPAAREAANAAYRETAQTFLRRKIDETLLQAKQQARRALSEETLFTDWRSALEEWELDLSELLRGDLLLEAEKLLRSRMQDPGRPVRFEEDEAFQKEAQTLCAAFWTEKLGELVAQERRLSALVAGRFDRYDRSILYAVRRLREAAPLPEQIYYDGFLREAEALAQKPPAAGVRRDYTGLATAFVLRVEEEEPEAQSVLRALHAAVLEAVVAADRELAAGR